jgi:hypothetical protein
MNQQNGFSLIALLLASWLGALLMINILALFMTFFHTWQLQNALSDLQTRSRFITTFLTQKIHAAGDASCGRQRWVDSDQAIGGDVLQLGACVKYHDRWQFMQTQYFLADGDHLFMKIKGSEREALLDGVSRFEVRYGVMLPAESHIHAYLPASAITDWHLVRSVKITFVLNTSAPKIEKIGYLYASLRERNS